MASNSTNMNLRLWDDADDPYDHNELVTNWNKVDAHDHTAGKGKQIPTAGLADDSVTNAKLAPNSVTTVEIANGTILAEDLADGAIGLGKIDPAVFSKITPLGTVIAWFRPTGAVSIPSGWVVADGSTVAEGDHDWGVGGVTIPDLRNKFILGAATSGTGTGPGTPPAEKAVGGNNTQTFPHTHTVAGHTHTVNSHSHTVNAHTHDGPWHAHAISADGLHSHGTSSANRGNSNVEGNKPGVHDYPENFAFQNHQHTISPEGVHSHGGATAGNAGTTTASAPGTSAVAPATDSVGLTTNSANGGGDIRPAFVGLLYLIKVKKPS